MLSFRTPTEDDMSFIYSSWLKSYRNSDYAKHICNELYYQAHAAIITALILKEKTLIAYDSDTNVLLGFICYSDQTIFYIYVKFVAREMGIAKELLAKTDIDLSLPILTTHSTLASQKSKLHLVYSPYAMLGE